MESGQIPDSAINASSSYVTNVGPKYGRWVKDAKIFQKFLVHIKQLD